ncbi:MAG: hypothetical protein HRT73_16010 [Flavobacteriales bacterium]|nr:hypothetical protein [Flavobacteriales bacterium]
MTINKKDWLMAIGKKCNKEYKKAINKDNYIDQRKCNLIATGVENETTAIWQSLLEDRKEN